MKRTLLSMALMSLTTLTMTSPSIAQDPQASGFRDPGEGSWYHPVEPDLWAYIGGNPAVIDQILVRIQSAPGPLAVASQPDTQTTYGPGNWMFEFTTAGDQAMQAALAAAPQNQKALYLEALTYYHVASAPHTNDPKALAALDKSGIAYGKAAEFLPGTFQAVTIPHAEASFGAHFHLPPGPGPFPVLVFSNGSDQSKETALSFYEKHLLPKGIAFLTLDTPGMGDSSAYDNADHETDKLHAAAVRFLQSHPKIQAQNVFLQGNSFGGLAATRAYLTRPELDLGGVVYSCGPMHGAFLAPVEAIDALPQFTLDGVKTRMGLPLSASTQDLADSVRGLSLGNAGFFEGDPIETPLLAIHTNQDPIAPLEELDELLLPMAVNHTRMVMDTPGHCVPHDIREPVIAAWILENLR